MTGYTSFSWLDSSSRQLARPVLVRRTKCRCIDQLPEGTLAWSVLDSLQSHPVALGQALAPWLPSLGCYKIQQGHAQVTYGWVLAPESSKPLLIFARLAPWFQKAGAKRSFHKPRLSAWSNLRKSIPEQAMRVLLV